MTQQGESSGGEDELIIFIIHHLLSFDYLFLFLCLIPSCLTLPHSPDVLSTYTPPFTISFLLFIRLCHMFCCLPAPLSPLFLFFLSPPLKPPSQQPICELVLYRLVCQVGTGDAAGCRVTSLCHVSLNSHRVGLRCRLFPQGSVKPCMCYLDKRRAKGQEMHSLSSIGSIPLCMYCISLVASKNGKCRDEFAYSLKL